MRRPRGPHEPPTEPGSVAPTGGGLSRREALIGAAGATATGLAGATPAGARAARALHTVDVVVVAPVSPG